jgi:serine/threonine protein kinase
MKQF